MPLFCLFSPHAMSAEETAGAPPPAASAALSKDARQGQCCIVELKRVQRHLRQPLLTGGGRQIATRKSILVRVQVQTLALARSVPTAQDTLGTLDAADASYAPDSPAAIGYGEAAPLPWFGTETPQQAFDSLCRLLRAAATDVATGGDADAGALSDGGAVGDDALSIASGSMEMPPLSSLPPSLPLRPLRRPQVRLRCCAKTLVQLVQMPDQPELHGSPCARWALQCALGQAGLLPVPLADFFKTGLTATSAPASALAAGASAGACAADGGSADVPEDVGARPVQLPIAALLQIPAALLLSGAEPTGELQTEELQAGVEQLFAPLLAAGFCVFKLKIGVRAFAQEAAFVSAAARHLLQQIQAAQLPQKSLKLRLDANGSLSAEALFGWLAMLEPLAPVIDFIEQPFAVGAEQAAAAVFAGKQVALALDESLTTLPQLEKIAAEFPQVVLVVKPSLLGDLCGYLRWLERPCNRGRKIIYSTALETGIGIHHALAVAAVAPAPVQPAGFGTGGLFYQDGLGCPPELPSALVAAGSGASAALGVASSPAPACTPAEVPAPVSPWIGLLSSAQMEAIWTRA